MRDSNGFPAYPIQVIRTEATEFSLQLAAYLTRTSKVAVAQGKKSQLFAEESSADVFFKKDPLTSAARNAAPIRIVANGTGLKFIQKQIQAYCTSACLLTSISSAVEATLIEPAKLCELPGKLAGAPGNKADRRKWASILSELLEDLARSPLGILDLSAHSDVREFIADQLQEDSRLMVSTLFHVANLKPLTGLRASMSAQMQLRGSMAAALIFWGGVLPELAVSPKLHGRLLLVLENLDVAEEDVARLHIANLPETDATELLLARAGEFGKPGFFGLTPLMKLSIQRKASEAENLLLKRRKVVAGGSGFGGGISNSLIGSATWMKLFGTAGPTFSTSHPKRRNRSRSNPSALNCSSNGLATSSARPPLWSRLALYGSPCCKLGYALISKQRTE